MPTTHGAAATTVPHKTPIKKWLSWAVVIAVVVALGYVVITRLMSKDKYDLVLTTGGEGGTYYPLGKALAGVIEKQHPNMKIEVMQSAGAEENILRVSRGEADLAFVQNDTKGPPNIRTIAPLYREVLHFVVRSDANIETLRDIKGKRISVGGEGSGTEKLVSKLLVHYGINYTQFEPHFLGSGPSADALIANEIDGMIFVSGIKSSACQKAVDSGQVEFISLGQPGVDAGEIEGFRFEYPFAEPYIIPVLTYASDQNEIGGLPQKPIATIAIRALLIARADLDDQAIFDVTHSLFSGRTELIDERKVAAQIREHFDAALLQFPVHPGAHAYYERDEPGFLVTYAESMGFVLSVVVTLAAMGAGLREWVRVRKKNRIDIYYLSLDDIIERLIEGDLEREELDELSRELLGMQHKAFRELVEEKLMADESFQIFQNYLAECKHEIEVKRAALDGKTALS